MGMRRNAAIAEWQKKAGIRESGKKELLREMSNTAFELIKVIELECSGIRDGDGFWSGSDPMGGLAQDMADLCNRFNELPSRSSTENPIEAERKLAVEDAADGVQVSQVPRPWRT
jgi:hypothetical protein